MFFLQKQTSAFHVAIGVTIFFLLSVINGPTNVYKQRTSSENKNCIASTDLMTAQLSGVYQEVAESFNKFGMKRILSGNSFLSVSTNTTSNENSSEILSFSIKISKHLIKQLQLPIYHITSSDCQLMKYRGSEHLKLQYKTDCKSGKQGNEKVSISEEAFTEQFHSKLFAKTHSVVEYIPVSKLSVCFNCTVSEIGNIQGKFGTLIPSGCGPHGEKAWQKDEPKRHEIIFTIASPWGGHYHEIMDQLPRLVPYLNFLRKNTAIKVHIHGNQSTTIELIQLLHLSKSRIIWGNCHANIVLVPSGTTCSVPSFFHIRVLSLELKHVLSHGTEGKNNIIIVKRTKKRVLLQTDELIFQLGQKMQNNNAQVVIFSDAALPSIQKTAKIFNSAMVVVAPHGAGLTNLLFSEPGTAVIEVLCRGKHGKATWSFARLAIVLGLRYFGVPQAAKQGCGWKNLSVKTSDVLNAFDTYFPHLWRLRCPQAWSNLAVCTVALCHVYCDRFLKIAQQILFTLEKRKCQAFHANHCLQIC